MENYQLLILGSNSATPTSQRYPSAQVLCLANTNLLIDCGEGTQMQLRRYKVAFHKINHIFISHLHGDHYLGLMGLLSSFHLYGRTEELHVFAPPMLKEIIDLHCKAANMNLIYPVKYHDLDFEQPQVVVDNKNFSVTAFALEHRIPTYGFLFNEKPGLRNVNKDFLLTEAPSFAEIINIKQGMDYINPAGKPYFNADITKAPAPPVSYAYCSDTRYTESILPVIAQVEWLYHEATFLKSESAMAKEKYHSTAFEAAQIAYKAHAKNLIVGHYSTRYDDLQLFLQEAVTVFANTHLADDGKLFTLR